MCVASSHSSLIDSFPLFQNSKQKAASEVATLFGADFEFLCRSHTDRFDDYEEFIHDVSAHI